MQINKEKEYKLEQIFNLNINEEEFNRRMDLIVENVANSDGLINPELMKEIEEGNAD